MSKLYVAYGSNLNIEQMKMRCPSARIYAKGTLVDWKLAFRGVDGNSHATILESDGDSVPVVLWTIERSDERMLDIYEGYPKYYYKDIIAVHAEDSVKYAMVYIMDESRKPGRPSPHYVKTIVKGYNDNGLDVEYLNSVLRENKEECVIA